MSDLEGLFTRVRTAGLPVRYERSGIPGTHRPAFRQIHGPGAPSRLGRALRERMPILSKTCPRWNSTALTVT
jgi:hypothetical protein